MNLQNIRDLYQYNYWANRLLLATAEKVTPEQLLAPTSHSFSSLLGTLVHTLDSEWHWRILLQGKGWPEPRLDVTDIPTLAALKQRWTEDGEQDMWTYLDSLRDEDLDGIIRYEGDPGV